MQPSYASGISDTPLIGQTIGDNLEDTVARLPDHEAIVSRHQDIRMTWSELNDEIDRVAKGLVASGLEPGDRVGIWSPNRVEWTLLQFATAKAGVILVNINPAYRTSELRYALNQSGCRWLVAAREFKTSDYAAMIETVRPDVEALERVILLDSTDWDDLVELGDEVHRDDLEARMASLDPDDPINIQYTSGTTGNPKGATLTHHNILNNGFFVGSLCRHTHEDRVCIPVPFYHCFGMVMGNLACSSIGSTMVIPAPSFEPLSVLEAVQEERCTSLYGVPTMFIAELGHDDFDKFDLSSLRTGIMAGSPCPVEVMKKVIDKMHMTEVTICYGMTETSPVSTQTRADDSLERRVGTVGRVHPHVEVKVVEPETGLTVARGEPGELCTRAYSVMRGYWNDPEKTDEAIDAGGWMHTGDLATMDDEGYLKIVGRSKDMIIRGGENVYPREIEEFLYSHPDVSDVSVVGVPDERYGEAIAAWIIPRPGADFDAEAIKDFCRGEIAHYKVPAYVERIDEFPMTVTGKVQKFKLVEQAVERFGLQNAVVETA